MKKITPILERKAIDLYAYVPNIKHSEVAEKLGVSNKTLMTIRKKPDFWSKVYDTFCMELEGQLPDIIRACAREALAGSVQAQRLLLEWSGKLQKTLAVNVSSPFEKWLMQEGISYEELLTSDEVIDAEVVIDELEGKKPNDEVKLEFERLDTELKKVNDKHPNWLNRRKELYSWNKRAKAVGVKPLPPKRPTKGQRLAWEESVVRREAELGVSQYVPHDYEE